MKHQVIRADATHLDALAPLFDAYRRFYAQPPDVAGARRFLAERLERGESVIFIALDDAGVALGFTQLYPLFSSVGMRRIWLLNDLYVAADARRGGVAMALMQAAREHAGRTRAAGLLLETQTTNRDAQALYEKLGYRRNEGTWFYYLTLE